MRENKRGREREGEKERISLLLAGVLPKWPRQPGLDKPEARNTIRFPNYLDHLQLPFQVHHQADRLEMERPGFEPALQHDMWPCQVAAYLVAPQCRFQCFHGIKLAINVGF